MDDPHGVAHMPRPPRLTYPGAVHHVTLRCNNREFLFEPPSLLLFQRFLRKARERFPLLLYNYCLMTNHVHLLFEVGKDDTLSKAMHWLSTSFTRRFNQLAARNGHVCEAR
jgi:putative transposase